MKRTKNYDSLWQQCMTFCRKRYQLSRDSFSIPSVIAGLQASGNVAGLCNWAEAMCTYHNVAKVVEPKIKTLREAEAELKVATKEKNAAEERMAIVQSKLDEMQVCFV